MFAPIRSKMLVILSLSLSALVGMILFAVHKAQQFGNGMVSTVETMTLTIAAERRQAPRTSRPWSAFR